MNILGLHTTVRIDRSTSGHEYTTTTYGYKFSIQSCSLAVWHKLPMHLLYYVFCILKYHCPCLQRVTSTDIIVSIWMTQYFAELRLAEHKLSCLGSLWESLGKHFGSTIVPGACQCLDLFAWILITITFIISLLSWCTDWLLALPLDKWMAIWQSSSVQGDPTYSLNGLLFVH